MVSLFGFTHFVLHSLMMVLAHDGLLHSNLTMVLIEYFSLKIEYCKGKGVAYDAIGVLSMLTSMNGSGSGDPELRRVRREWEGVFLVLIFRFLVDYSYLLICLIKGERRWTSTDLRDVLNYFISFNGLMDRSDDLGSML